MTDNDIELTRRKILAGLGAVGAAGAGAGFGTTALFSDQESFTNNQITAGTLDLKVDWEEHYSFPQIYDLPDPEEDVEVLREEPDNPADFTALPDPTDPVVWVADEDFDEYFGDTIIEAFPDAEGSPIEADFSKDPGGGQPCEVLADVPQDLGAYNDTTDNGLGRTRNGDTETSGGDPRPLVSLTDVKPDDFGELTLSTHLCFNDGYLWLSMPGGLDESGGTTSEPEMEVGNNGSDDGELAENIQTALWYDDDCSNTIDGEPDPLIAIALIDTSNSIDASDMQTIAEGSNAFVQQLNNKAETEVAAGVMTFSDDDKNPGSGNESIVLQNDVEKLEEGGAYLDSNGNGEFDPGNNLLPDEGSGGTPLAPALDLARELLNDRAETLINTSGNGFGPNTRKSILVLTDGLPDSPSLERYQLVDPSGNDVQAQNGTGVTNAQDGQFLSDVFDGFVDGSTSTTGIRDEAALVARDIDVGGKSDTGPSGTSDDPDISGENGITLRTVGVGTQNVSSLNSFLTRVATNDGLFYNVAGLSGPDLVNTVDDIVEDLNVTGPAEKVIFRGTLEELATQLDPDQQGPIPLDGMKMNNTIDEIEADPGVGPADGRNCFDASSTECFGFAWWVPRSVGNEIQGDTVEFDLQFLAEQCRNNDNPGQTVL